MSLLAMSCADNVQDLMHLLAKAAVKDSEGIIYLRANVTYHDCEEVDSAITCGNAGVSPESVLKKLFYVDCDNKLTINISMPNP